MPRTPGAGDVSARVAGMVRGNRYGSVIVMAAAGVELEGRIHVTRREEYPSPAGSFPVDLRSVDELCDEDDDIYADDRGLFEDDGIGVQLPFLREAIGSFELVPVIMGDESPDYCRELGSAVGEIMYNKPTLLVASVDVLGGSSQDHEQFRERLTQCDIDHLMRIVRSERVRLDGGGPLMAALIAAERRGARTVSVTDLTAPAGAGPGGLAAVVSRG